MFGTVCTANTCSEVMSTTVVKSVKSEVVEQCALIVILVGLRAKEQKSKRTSGTGTRTLVWNVRGPRDNHLHYTGCCCS